MDLDALYRTEARPMLAFFARRTYDAQVAVDLVAETFGRALEQQHRCRGEAAPWLWGIARNVLHDTLRRGRIEARAMRRLGIEPACLTEVERARIEDLAELESLRALVRAALAGLGGHQREPVRLRVVEELSYADVAARLGVCEQTARARVSRGRGAPGAAPDRATA